MSLRRVRLRAAAVPAVVACLCLPRSIAAQGLPGPVYHRLAGDGHEELAERLEDRMALRAHPDSGDVADLLRRWDAADGGPRTGYDWLAVSRLWQRAGRVPEAEVALYSSDAATEDRAPAAELLLEQARLAFLSGDAELGARSYFRGCRDADQAATREYWIDLQALATPREVESWERFLTLPPNQRDLCGRLRDFWNERAAASAMTVPRRLQEHYERLAYARENFLRRGGKRPKTLSTELGRPGNAIFDDRGIVYLRMGEPDRKTFFAGAPSTPANDAVSAECYQPNQSWAYDYPDGPRVFHFTTFYGTDDWWLIQNLGDVYRCGRPSASSSNLAVGRLTPLNEGRVTQPAGIAHMVLKDLYESRQGLDPRYRQLAFRMRYDGSSEGAGAFRAAGPEALVAQRQLQEERSWTRRDASFAIRAVPERPRVSQNERIEAEVLQFRGSAPDRTRAWLDGLIEARGLRADSLADGRFRYRVDAVWAVLGEDERYRRESREFETFTDHRLGKDESVPVRIPLQLAPGQYRYTLVVRDRHGPRKSGEPPEGSYLKDTLRVRPFDDAVLQLSDVAVAPDSGGSWDAGRQGARLRISPVHLTGPDGIAYVYYEVYGLPAGREYHTDVRLERDGSEPVAFRFTGEAAPDDRGITSGLLRLDLTRTPRGAYTMSVSVSDPRTGEESLPFRTALRVDREE